MKTLAIDPGKFNTFYVLFDGMRFVGDGCLKTPAMYLDIVNNGFRKYVKTWLNGKVKTGDDVVIERYMHRAAAGGNVAEILHGIIDAIAFEALRLGCNVHLVVASAHKNSYSKFHTKLYPVRTIKRLGDKYGTWRPRLKRIDPCEHIMDAATLGCYRILKRKGRI